MSAWRRRALEAFPDLVTELNGPGFTPYDLFAELLPRVRDAHVAGDEERLRSIYGFAAWCFGQPGGELRNAAGVAFYEHLFDSHPRTWPDVVRHLGKDVVRDVMPLWSARLPPDDLARVRRLAVEHSRVGG